MKWRTVPCIPMSIDCSGFQLNGFSKTVTGVNVRFHPNTLYDPIVPDCNGGRQKSC